MAEVKGYLTPYLRTRPAPFAKSWQWMDEFRVIRNWMAHNGGKVREDTQPNGNWANAARFVRRNRGLIRFGGRGEIVVQGVLVDRALDQAADALDRLHRTGRELYQ